MKTLSLEARIERSKRAMSGYPDWVKNSSRFQGGGVVRDHANISSHDRDKVIELIKETN